MSTPEGRSREQAIEAYGVLDAPPRPELLALVELAARVAGVPMAAVDLVTATEQHRVAGYGVPTGVSARQESMSATVVEERRPALVPDMLLDERFRAQPSVTGESGGVRFYAAHPLVTPGQVVIGALCVFDEQPREVVPELGQLLGTLADRVVDALQLELRTRQLAAAEERLGAFAAQVSHDLRNPLSSVRMSLELARDELADDADAARLLERAERGVDRMDRMIGDLLRGAQGEAGPDRGPLDPD